MPEELGRVSVISGNKVAIAVRSEWDRREGMKFNDPILDRSHREGKIIGRYLILRIGMVRGWCVFLLFAFPTIL